MRALPIIWKRTEPRAARDGHHALLGHRRRVRGAVAHLIERDGHVLLVGARAEDLAHLRVQTIWCSQYDKKRA